jgi:hypothetical protein
MPSPAWLRWGFDRFDEAAARRLRRRLGRDGQLVSWQRRPGHGGDWVARLSGPALPLTVERRGRTRRQAIRRAGQAWAFLVTPD